MHDILKLTTYRIFMRHKQEVLMIVKTRWLLALIVALYVSWLLVSLDSEPVLEKEFKGPVWLFNFAPESAPDFLT